MDLTVLYATTVVPFDEETLRNAAARASADVILIEPYYEGGLVPEIARALQRVPARIETIGVPHRILEKYGPPERFDQEVGLTVDGIRARVSRFLNPGTKSTVLEILPS
jgi:transketolase